MAEQETRPDLESMRLRLEEIRQRILREVVGLEDDLEDVRSIEGIEHGDVAQREALERSLAQVDEVVREELEEAEAALRRIDAGIYGVCEDCGRAIAPARLEALPSARRCADCQERFERESAPPGAPGG